MGRFSLTRLPGNIHGFGRDKARGLGPALDLVLDAAQKRPREQRRSPPRVVDAESMSRA
jgi:hypothetical protein